MAAMDDLVLKSVWFFFICVSWIMVLVGDWDATPASFVSLFPVYYFDIDDISKASFT